MPAITLITPNRATSKCISSLKRPGFPEMRRNSPIINKIAPITSKSYDTLAFIFNYIIPSYTVGVVDTIVSKLST